MKKNILSVLIFSFTVFCVSAQEGIVFKFKHHKGDSVSHVSTVEEETFVNGRLNNHTQFINRTSTTIVDVSEDKSALLNTHYMTTQNSLLNRTQTNLSWGEENFVTIHRKITGELYDSDNLFLPTVRNIPCFTGEAIAPGDSWKCQGFEVHDLRELFGMDDAVSIPFTAIYTYEGDVVVGEEKLQIITVEYTFKQIAPRNEMSTYQGAQGYAQQKIYWDNDKGDIDHFNEEFEIQLFDIYGNDYLFRGVSHGEVTEYKSVNDDETVEKLQKTIKKNKLEDVTVKRGEKGLTISLDKIQFEPDSNILLPSEQKKLQKIGKILKDFSNDLLITGHCAERGTASARQKLSEERAQAVADFLVKKGIRDEYHIFTQGKGSTEPVASNDTEEGRIKNRRVEIILVD